MRMLLQQIAGKRPGSLRNWRKIFRGRLAALLASVFAVVVANAAENAPPTISAIPFVTTMMNTHSDIVSFTIGDLETPPEKLALTVTSSDWTLARPENVGFSGTGTERLMTIVPEKGRCGTASITVTVTDEAGASSSRSFRITVVTVQCPPAIIAIADQVTKVNTPTQPVVFLVDAVCPACNVSPSAGQASPNVLARSSNPALIPPENVLFNHQGNNWSVVIVPSQDKSGSARITVTVENQSGDAASMTFNVVVLENQPPTIGKIADQVAGVTEIVTVPVTVNDPDDSPDSLTLKVISPDEKLFPSEGVFVTGSGTNRFITIQTPSNDGGSYIFTTRVKDPAGASTETQFVLRVSHVLCNGSPTITPIPDQVIINDSVTREIAFSVFSYCPPVPASSLTLVAHSDNLALLPTLSFAFGGSDGSRTLKITPPPNMFGKARVWVTVLASDGFNTRGASTSFYVTVKSSNQPPTIGPIADQTLNMYDPPSGITTFTVSDPDDPPDSLQLSAHSSNSALVPVSNIQFGGAGGARLLIVSPENHKIGASMITVTVSDPHGATAEMSFEYRVFRPSRFLFFPPQLGVNGAFQMNFDPIDSRNHLIEISEDLRSWRPFLTVTNALNNIFISIPSQVNERGFFRVRLLDP